MTSVEILQRPKSKKDGSLWLFPQGHPCFALPSYLCLANVGSEAPRLSYPLTPIPHALASLQAKSAHSKFLHCHGQVCRAIQKKSHQTQIPPQELGFNHPIAGWQATICWLSEKLMFKARFYMFIWMCALFSGGTEQACAVN